jgi:hypothetical protein
MTTQDSHADRLDQWLTQVAKDHPTNSPALLERAFRVVWERAFPTLSEVTLVAIADRALHLAKERFPLLASIEVREEGFSFAKLDKGGGNDADLTQALRLLLLEFLSIIGALSGDILTPLLHAEISGLNASVLAAENQDPKGDSSRTRLKKKDQSQ